MGPSLKTSYLGLELRSPLVASASPLTGRLENLRQLEKAGAGAVVLPSIFEEQIENAERQFHLEPAAASYFPEDNNYRVSPAEYLKLISEARKATAIPILASLNGNSSGNWTEYAEEIQDAGASALELNIYFVPTEPTMTAEDVEARYAEVVATVRKRVKIPISVKVGNNFTSLPHFAARLMNSGANGLVLFNRALEPDIELESLRMVPSLVLSQRTEMRPPLRWIAILREYVKGSLAASSGIHHVDDVIKFLLVGADAVMMTSALLTRGIGRLKELHDELSKWLGEHNYDSIERIKGTMSRANCLYPAALERGSYMRALSTSEIPKSTPRR